MVAAQESEARQPLVSSITTMSSSSTSESNEV